MSEAIEYRSHTEHEKNRVISALAYCDGSFSDLNLSTMAGRIQYAENALVLFRHLQHAKLDQDSITQIACIIEALEGWTKYTGPRMRKRRMGR